MATERISIIISETGARRVVRAISGIGDSANRSGNSVRFLQRSLAVLGSAVLIRDIIKLSDTFIQVENRLKLVTGSTQELIAVQKELFKVANETRSSFEATAELYTRVALSARNLGVTQREVIDFTKALNQAVILSGASAQEARNGIIQFAQGLAANRLAGDELRAVLEQLPLVADVIAKELGVTRGSLRELAAQGKITGQTILEAFGPDTQREIQEQFNKTIPTIAQSLTVLQNNLIETLGEFNKGSGVFSGISKIILFVANNFERFARGILAGLVIPALIGTVAAVRSLTVALLANPFGLFIAGISTAVALLAAFQDKIFLTEGSLTTLGDIFVSLGDEFGAVFTEALKSLDDLLGGVFGFTDQVDISLKDILTFAAQTADGFVGFFVGSFFALGRAVQGVAELVDFGLTGALNGLIIAAESVFNFIIRQLNVFRIRTIATINELIAGINKVSDALGGGQIALLDVGAGFIEQVDFKTFENELSDGAKDLGASVSDGFLEGFESVTGVQDLLERAITGANNRASQREIARLDAARAANQNDPLGNAPPGGAEGDDLATIALRNKIEQLVREQEVIRSSLGLSAQQRSAASELLKIEEELRRKNVELTDTQRALLTSTLAETAALESQSDILSRLGDASANAKFELEQLNALFESGQVSAAEYRGELRRLRLEELSGNQDVFSGFERGFIQIESTIANFGAQSEATLVNAFSNGEDALVQFVQTGQVEFSSLVDSMLADLTRLLARQAAFGLLASFGGGGGFAAAGGLNNFLFGGSSFGGAREAGGPVRPDQSFLVGEKGPELFTPPSSGMISPLDSMSAPEVNVNVVNVTDPNMVKAAMSDPAVQQTIVNVIRSKRQSVRTALGV